MVLLIDLPAPTSSSNLLNAFNRTNSALTSPLSDIRLATTALWVVLLIIQTRTITSVALPILVEATLDASDPLLGIKRLNANSRYHAQEAVDQCRHLNAPTLTAGLVTYKPFMVSVVDPTKTICILKK